MRQTVWRELALKSVPNELNGAPAQERHSFLLFLYRLQFRVLSAFCRCKRKLEPSRAVEYLAPIPWNSMSDLTAYANVECWRRAKQAKEYNAAEEQRRGDLRDDSRSDANYFFWAVGLAAVGSGLFPVRLNILVSIGAFDLLSLHGKSLGPVAVDTAVAIGAPECQRVRIGIAASLIKTGFESSNPSAGARFLVVEIRAGRATAARPARFSSPSHRIHPCAGTACKGSAWL